MDTEKTTLIYFSSISDSILNLSAQNDSSDVWLSDDSILQGFADVKSLATFKHTMYNFI